MRSPTALPSGAPTYSAVSPMFLWLDRPVIPPIRSICSTRSTSGSPRLWNLRPDNAGKPIGKSTALAAEVQPYFGIRCRINVAGPMLEQSEQVDNETLVAAARTQSQQHLLAISRRASLDESVTDVLVERGDRPVVLSTAANPGARISNSGYMTLIQRSTGDDELATCVGSRSDIPRQHLFRLITRASRDVQIKLEATHPSMASTVQDAVAEAATMILDKAGAASRDYAAARTKIASLHSGGTLGESEVAAFAAANQFEETAAALAILCGLPIEVADQAMVQGQHESVLVIAKAIGFSWPTVRTILRMCAGARGISPGELELCFGTFSRLKLATARQVIQFQSKRFRGIRFGRPAA